MEIIALIISGISLLVAILSFGFSLPAQKLQNKINEMEIKLKEYELNQIESKNKKSACVEARVIKISSGKYRLKVWNSGTDTAFNVSAHFEDGTNIFIGDHDKMPYEILAEHKSFEMWLITHMGSANKFKIITEWEDFTGTKQSKEQMGDL